jgi:hypothetical protein
VKGAMTMTDRTFRDPRTTLSLQERKPSRRAPRDRSGSISPDRIDRFRPLTFSVAGNDLDVLHVLVFPEGARIVLSLMTARGTATFTMQPITAREVGDGLGWLARETEKAS